MCKMRPRAGFRALEREVGRTGWAGILGGRAGSGGPGSGGMCALWAKVVGALPSLDHAALPRLLRLAAIRRKRTQVPDVEPQPVDEWGEGMQLHVHSEFDYEI
jgi:hypothetical protein